MTRTEIEDELATLTRKKEAREVDAFYSECLEPETDLQKQHNAQLMSYASEFDARIKELKGMLNGETESN